MNMSWGWVMKLRIILVFCMILILSVLTGCQKTWTLQSEGIAAGNCEIVENRNVICEKPFMVGVYRDYEQWKNAVEDTDDDVILKRKDLYDEDFFEESVLICLINVSSGNAQWEYEGYEIDDDVLYIDVSTDTDKLLNELHAYYVFFVTDKSEAGKINSAELFFE